jgi:eukaryotic-like serine/threonine-protein kinase
VTPERWRQITETFHAALAREGEARQGFVAEACGADAELRAEVEALLVAQDAAGSFGERPLYEASDLQTLQPGRTDPGDELRTEAAEALSPVPPRRPLFAWLLWPMGVVALAVSAYAGFLLAHAGGASLGWDETPRRNAFYVERVAASGPAAGVLQPGDRVLALNGVPAIGLAGTLPHRHVLSAGDGYALRIIRDGQPRDVLLTVGAGPPAPPDRILHLLISLVWIGVGLFIGWARPDQPMARTACLAAVCMGLAFLEERVIHSGLHLGPLHGVLGYHFFCLFPAGSMARGPWRAVLAMLYATGGAAVAVRTMCVVPILAGVSTAAPTALFQVSGYFDMGTFAAAVLGILAVIPHRYRQLRDEDQRRRVRWVVYGSSLALLTDLVYLGVSFAEGEAGPRLALVTNACSAAIPLCMAYAVVKHRVLDIRVAVRGGLQYLLARRALQAAVALPAALLAYAILVVHRHRTIADLVADNRGYLLWVALAGISLRFRGPLLAWLDHRFFRDQLDPEQLLLGLLDEGGRVESMSELSHLLTSRLDLALHPKTMYVWYRDPDELAAASAADPVRTPPDFPSQGRWRAWLEARGGAAALPAPGEGGLPPEEARWFADRDVRILVPITDSGERMVGALLVGEKKSEEPYDAGDRRLLQAIARQVAVLRENVRLRARVSEEQRIRHDVLSRLDERMPGLLKECPDCGACSDGPAAACERCGQPLALSLPVARTVDGRYRLERLIGRGGMGAVYEARDLRLGRTVALKILLGEAFGRPSALRRFRREAQATARLNHPNVVSIFDFGPLEGQGAYLVMEHVSGSTLRDELQRRGALAPSMAALWFAPLLDGLGVAHAEGIIHRDLKPENVIGHPAPGGRLAVKILDFGLAKLVSSGATASTTGNATATVTREGIVLGTLAYMSPEQLQARDTDARTDIFAVGVMLVEALTGHRPFEGDREADLSRTLPPGRRLIPETSPAAEALEALLRKCLAHRPGDRYGSAALLRDDLIPALRAWEQRSA